MDNALKEILRENEHVCWQGKPATLRILERGVKFQTLRKWILTVAFTTGLLVVYCSANENWSTGFIGLVALVAAVILASPFMEVHSVQKCRYYITDQRAILQARDKTFYYMNLDEIDEYRVVEDLADEKCLVLGSILFPEINKQLRWRACHPKMDVKSNDGQDSAQGMVFYGVPNLDDAVAFLERRKHSQVA